MKTIVLALSLIALAASLSWSTAADKPKIKLLFLVGGGTHAYKPMYPVLLDVLYKTGDFDVTLTEDRSQLAAPAVNKYDVILLFTHAGTPTPEQEAGLCKFVENGKGVAGIHTATATWKESDRFWQLVGGRFKGHSFGKVGVRIKDTDHPITCWLKDFEIEDEDYHHTFREDAPIHVLATWAKDDAPAAWTRDYGKGRVFINTLGHTKKVWEDPSFQEISLRGIYWAAGRSPKSPPESK